MLEIDPIQRHIDIFEKCTEKSRCNCFNDNARYWCADATICSLINYYQNKIEEIKDAK